VVDVGVGEEDAADGCAEGASGGEDVVGGVGEVGVDEGEAVGFADEIAVDEAETRELVAVGGDRGRFHGGLDATSGFRDWMDKRCFRFAHLRDVDFRSKLCGDV
jgi:hypothetical protein